VAGITGRLGRIANVTRQDTAALSREVPLDLLSLRKPACIRERIEGSLQVPVLDVPAAITFAEALVRQGHKTSKLRAFKEPEPNIYA
jgi:hypothetical protein